jgi:hypothetical protein
MYAMAWAGLLGLTQALPPVHRGYRGSEASDDHTWLRAAGMASVICLALPHAAEEQMPCALVMGYWNAPHQLEGSRCAVSCCLPLWNRLAVHYKQSRWCHISNRGGAIIAVWWCCNRNMTTWYCIYKSLWECWVGIGAGAVRAILVVPY